MKVLSGRFVKAPVELLDEVKDPSAIALYLACMRHADWDTGVLKIALREIATQVGIKSETTASRLMKILAAAGFAELTGPVGRLRWKVIPPPSAMGRHPQKPGVTTRHPQTLGVGHPPKVGVGETTPPNDGGGHPQLSGVSTSISPHSSAIFSAPLDQYIDHPDIAFGSSTADGGPNVVDPLSIPRSDGCIVGYGNGNGNNHTVDHANGNALGNGVTHGHGIVHTVDAPIVYGMDYAHGVDDGLDDGLVHGVDDHRAREASPGVVVPEQAPTGPPATTAQRDRPNPTKPRRKRAVAGRGSTNAPGPVGDMGPAPTGAHNPDKRAETLELIPPEPGGDAVARLFAVWVETTGKTRARLDERRRQWLRTGLKDWGLHQAEAAIRGMKFSAFHNGDNDRDKLYNEPEHIFRKASVTEEFIALWEKHKNPKMDRQKLWDTWEAAYLKAIHELNARPNEGGCRRLDGVVVPLTGGFLDVFATNHAATRLVRRRIVPPEGHPQRAEIDKYCADYERESLADYFEIQTKLKGVQTA